MLQNNNIFNKEHSEQYESLISLWLLRLALLSALTVLDGGVVDCVMMGLDVVLALLDWAVVSVVFPRDDVLTPVFAAVVKDVFFVPLSCSPFDVFLEWDRRAAASCLPLSASAGEVAGELDVSAATHALSVDFLPSDNVAFAFLVFAAVFRLLLEAGVSFAYLRSFLLIFRFLFDPVLKSETEASDESLISSSGSHCISDSGELEMASLVLLPSGEGGAIAEATWEGVSLLKTTTASLFKKAAGRFWQMLLSSSDVGEWAVETLEVEGLRIWSPEDTNKNGKVRPEKQENEKNQWKEASFFKGVN